MDTAVVLQARAGSQTHQQAIAELRGILAGLSSVTPLYAMAGRTHLQQALPVTFRPHNTAIHPGDVDRHAKRLAQ